MTVRKLDRRKQRTRQLLRDALMALIVAQGYDTITVQDIADAANVARTTFYLHFKDKDELLFEGMREMYETMFEEMQQNPADNPFGLTL
ncbi:MAG: helix-turn-helix transcriptional regulator, partial [Anaerolineae bacterium]|nr:helix-turn-helix transcriptional regulator [Anaerolineae bacterium]